MNVGVLTPSLSRSAGGLFWSVRHLSQALERTHCNVQVFGTRDEFSDVDISSWGSLPLHLFDRTWPETFGYARGLKRSVFHANLDLLHLHGIWMYPSVISKRFVQSLKRPLIISPRGMLEPWALANSSLKKRIAGGLFENANLRHAKCLHALCEAEYKAIRDHGLTNPVAIIPNGVERVANKESNGNIGPLSCWPENRKVLFFLSRIHPKKGLMQLLHAWSRIAKGKTDSNKTWSLVLAGWDQGGHRAELETLTRELRIESSVIFTGPVFGEQKAKCLSNADAFILPSFSEGLPMAVLEAWSFGLPVLMTEHCHLQEGFSNGAAIHIEPEPESIALGLNRLMGLTDEERKSIGLKGLHLVETKYRWKTIAAQMYSVYEWMSSGAEKPECVVLD